MALRANVDETLEFESEGEAAPNVVSTTLVSASHYIRMF